MAKRGRTEDLLKEFENLTIHSRTYTMATTRATPPMWVQLKELTQEAKNVVTCTQQPRNPGTLFLAMLAIVSCQSTGDGPKEE
ncbi:PREDICTED: endogenous retrovirus group K member 21 Rec protein-like [Propithecus coquereli]|uniref:endogenous retrovirus group K member 21 Rec protein-like n=1 Tax=Propithecus coquereli TaxID=379532 RepID=UPI00063F036A|nr:PREDICTED: endogenous retrovirus group K member 21 Rec protein-like [Propithecus coquereli]